MPLTASLETRVKEPPGIFDTAPLMASRLGLYCKVNVPEVTLSPLDSAMGMPLPGMLLATLMVAKPMDTPGVVEDSSWLVAVARALWNVVSTLAPEVTSLVTITTELGVLPAPLLTPICVARPPLDSAV